MPQNTNSESARPNVPAASLGGYRRLMGVLLGYWIPLPAAAVAYVAGASDRPTALAVVTASTACVLVRAAVEFVRIQVQREQADHWIITHAGQPPNDAILQARLDELLGARLRINLAAAFRRLADDAATPRRRDLPGAQAVRCELRPYIYDVVELAEALSDLHEPVSPRGVALANRLLTEAGGPLHNSQRARELTIALPQTLRALHE